MKQNKDNIFHMRVTLEEKKKIATLAKRLGCRESEAIRRVVNYSLALPKTALKAKR
jgi:hypothetical protein